MAQFQYQLQIFLSFSHKHFYPAMATVMEINIAARSPQSVSRMAAPNCSFQPASLTQAQQTVQPT